MSLIRKKKAVSPGTDTRLLTLQDKNPERTLFKRKSMLKFYRRFLKNEGVYCTLISNAYLSN
jgi:hypothetical protein